MQLLKGNRSFRRLWSGQVISELGNWFNFIAGLGLVRSVSGAAPEVTAIMLVARLAPFALFAPIAGAVADRWSRRTLMLATDIARAVVGLGFLFVDGPEDLWLAYTCAIVSTGFAAFFEAAKNASMPSIAGDEGLLAGNALLFSSRFLLMSIGVALGGWTALQFGYRAAFIINSASFLVSAYSIWLIPDRETRQTKRPEEQSQPRTRFWTDIHDGWKFIVRHPLVLAILCLNILWATGGGASNLISDQLGGLVFAPIEGLNSDAGVSAFYTAAGIGLFIGMLIARRVGAHIELHRATVGFIGWTLVAHGLIYALMGVVPRLWMACALLLLSRLLLGVEFAVQETLLMRLVPDGLRGRTSTTDRAVEIFFTSLSTLVAGWSLLYISPRTLTVFSGLLSASPGLWWLLMFARGRLRMPERISSEGESEERKDEAVLASTG
jgi:MFS family permease